MQTRPFSALSSIVAVTALSVASSAGAQNRLRSLADVQLDASLAAIDQAITEAQDDVASNREQLVYLRSRRAELISRAADLRAFSMNPFSNTPPPLSFIVKGSTTFAFGATGALLRQDDGGVFDAHCSGAMIGCETFLTARHCVEDDLDSANYSVFLQGEGLLEVETILPAHPEYAQPFADLQLLKLASPITAVKPVPIIAPVNAGTSISATITGFGHTRLNGNDQGLKRFGAVMTQECNLTGPHGETLAADGFICWLFDNKMATTCHVDSGGPLYAGIVSDDGNLIGTTSGGDEQCAGDLQSVDVDLDFFSGWIGQTGGDDVGHLSCTPPGRESIEFVTALADESSVTEKGALNSYDLELDPNTTEVRIALNAEDRTENDIDLKVELATGSDVPVTCNEDHPGNFSYCRFDITEPGAALTITVSQKGQDSGSGRYQLLVAELHDAGDGR